MRKEKKEFDYIIIGAGSGGLLVAVGLLRLGRNIAVITKNIGGDFTHYGCVPSKTLLHLSKEYRLESNLNKKVILKSHALQTVRDTVQSFVTEENDIIPKDRYFEGTAELLVLKLLEFYKITKKQL